jgi:YHS domain-containing protein
MILQPHSLTRFWSVEILRHTRPPLLALDDGAWQMNCTMMITMKKYLTLLAVLAFAACAPSKEPPKTASATEMRSIESTDMRRTTMDPPPMLNDMTPVAKPKPNLALPADQQVTDTTPLANVPFAPAIAMDPVDGSKIPIKINTPTYELKGHIYYFANEANRQEFIKNPTQYLIGAFSHL